MCPPFPGRAGDQKGQASCHERWQKTRKQLDLLEQRPWLFILKHGYAHGFGNWTIAVYLLFSFACRTVGLCLLISALRYAYSLLVGGI